MENQVTTSSASSSSPHPEKTSENMIVAVEESKEKAAESNNNNPNLGTSQEVVSERSPSLGSAVVPTGTEITTMIYPSRSNKIYTCQFCSKGFSTSQALGGHQNAHKQDREWEKKRKEMEDDFPGLAFLNPYVDKPHLLLGGYSQDALSNDNHLGITLEPFKRRGSGLYTSFNGGGFGDMKMTIVPRMTPTRFFTGNTLTNGSSSRSVEPRPSYNNYPPLRLRNVPPFLPPPPPLPPRTTNLSRDLYSQENGPSVENLISKIGKNNVVEIDDDDDDDEDETEEGKSKSWGNELSLSL